MVNTNLLKINLKSLILLVLFCICFASKAQSQNVIKRYFDHTLKDTSDPAKPKFIAYPTVAYAPETS